MGIEMRCLTFRLTFDFLPDIIQNSIQKRKNWQAVKLGAVFPKGENVAKVWSGKADIFTDARLSIFRHLKFLDSLLSQILFNNLEYVSPTIKYDNNQVCVRKKKIHWLSKCNKHWFKESALKN